jgi:hypothetical protein
MLSKPIPINTRVDKQLLERIEAWRGQVRPIVPPRSEALRMLIEKALGTDKPEKKTA